MENVRGWGKLKVGDGDGYQDGDPRGDGMEAFFWRSGASYSWMIGDPGACFIKDYELRTNGIV
jgi:hypothetical protein